MRRGVDLRTVQAWLGHEDISVTGRYLAPEEHDVQQDRINRAFGDKSYAAVAS